MGRKYREDNAFFTRIANKPKVKKIDVYEYTIPKDIARDTTDLYNYSLQPNLSPDCDDATGKLYYYFTNRFRAWDEELSAYELALELGVPESWLTVHRAKKVKNDGKLENS